MTSSVSTQSRPTDRLSSYTRHFVTASLGNKVASCRQVGVTKMHARVTQTCGIQLSYETEIIARMWRSVSMVRGRAVCYISCRNWRTDALRTRKQVRCYKSPEMKKRTYTRARTHTHINFVSTDDDTASSIEIFYKQRVERGAESCSNDLINLICHFGSPLRRE